MLVTKCDICKKEMTLDKLAGMVSRRFDEIEEKMVTKTEVVDFRFEVNKRLGKFEYQTDEVYDILKRYYSCEVFI